jgi:hypothetical protein
MALCWPAEKAKQRRLKSGVDCVRQVMKQVRRWLPERRLVLIVDGNFAAVSLALACGTNRVVMLSRLCWYAALYLRPGLQPPASGDPNPERESANVTCKPGLSVAMPLGRPYCLFG